MMYKSALLFSAFIGLVNVISHERALADRIHASLETRLADHLGSEISNSAAGLSVPPTEQTLELLVRSQPLEDLKADIDAGITAFVGVLWEGGVYPPGVKCANSISRARNVGQRIRILDRGLAAHHDVLENYATQYNAALLRAGVVRPDVQEDCAPSS